MGLFVSTVSTNIAIAELGITLVHPTTNFQVDAQFSSDDIKGATSLTSAILAGTLTWKRTAGGSTETASSYDPDFVDFEYEATGTGNPLDQSPRWRDLDAQYISSTSDVNTTSTSDVALLLLTANFTGKYEVDFSSSTDNSSNGFTNRVTIYINGVAQLDSTRRAIPRVAAGIGTAILTLPISTGGQYQVTAGQNIEIRWRVSGGTGTMHERSMKIKRVG